LSIPPLGRTWSVWSSVAACLLGWWHSKVFSVRAVVAGCPLQSGVSKARRYGGWEGVFLRLMGEVARRVGV
jgi:hypothetical protein